MYNASNLLLRAMTSYVTRGKKRKKNKIQVGTKKTCYYLPDTDYYWNVYLKSDHWKNLKKEKLLVNPNCEECDTDRYLDIHHINYKNLYDVALEDLKTLCRKCHSKEHINPKFKPKDVKKEIIKSIIRRKQKKRYVTGFNIYSPEYQKYLEKCRLERALIKNDMHHYHKINESVCQIEKIGELPI